MNRTAFLQKSTLTGFFAAAALGAIGNSRNSNGKPKKATPELKNSYWYRGHLMSVLIDSKDTNGSFSLCHIIEVKGLEPPRHVHSREDESFYILDGVIEYSVEDKVLHAVKGDWVFLPKNIPHSFKVITETAEALILLTPGGFENFFIEMSEPAKAMEMPPKPQGPPDIKKMNALSNKYGFKFLPEL